jgi:hypothetical protein
MAEPTFSYSVDNDRRFREAVAKAAAQIGDLTIPLTLISQDFYKSERAIFSLQGPGQYPPISPKYAKAKLRRYGFIYPLLKASGRLATSMLDPTDGDAINFIDRGGTRLTIGTTVPYGIYPQSDAPRQKQPLRKFLFIGPEAAQFATSEQMGRLQRWLGIVNDYTVKKLELMGESKRGG